MDVECIVRVSGMWSVLVGFQTFFCLMGYCVVPYVQPNGDCIVSMLSPMLGGAHRQLKL